MDIDLQRVYDIIFGSVRAEDVFGDLIDRQNKTSKEQLLEAVYADLAAIVDPKKYTYPDDREFAADAQFKLKTFYEKAKEKLASGFYGATANPSIHVSRGRPAFATEKRSYYLGQPIAEGDIATIYVGDCVMGDDFAGRVAIKIVNDPADNDLARNEIRALTELHSKKGAQRKHLPILLDNFLTEDDQVGLVFRFLDDSYDLLAVKEKYPRGVDRKHMVWMLNRLLSAAGYAHNWGMVHANIEPSNLMVRPQNHNLFMIDWTSAVIRPAETGDTFKVYNPEFSAPEVKEGGPATPASDLYSIGKCMIYILGGNVEDNTMPDTVEEELQRFIHFLVLESQGGRAQDAWKMHHKLISLVEGLWGPRKFLVFSM
ncbi:MAG: protein kinase [Patescibacteria group bacterium]|jgi:serine/threonine protein kinase